MYTWSSGIKRNFSCNVLAALTILSETLYDISRAKGKEIPKGYTFIELMYQNKPLKAPWRE